MWGEREVKREELLVYLGGRGGADVRRSEKREG